MVIQFIEMTYKGNIRHKNTRDCRTTEGAAKINNKVSHISYKHLLNTGIVSCRTIYIIYAINTIYKICVLPLPVLTVGKDTYINFSLSMNSLNLCQSS